MNGTPRPGQVWVDRVTGNAVVVLFVSDAAVTVIDAFDDGGWQRQAMRPETLMREYRPEWETPGLVDDEHNARIAEGDER